MDNKDTFANLYLCWDLHHDSQKKTQYQHGRFITSHGHMMRPAWKCQMHGNCKGNALKQRARESS